MLGVIGCLECFNCTNDWECNDPFSGTERFITNCTTKFCEVFNYYR